MDDTFTPAGPASRPSFAVIGADAFLAARPATPVQVVHACSRAGYDAAVPATWGDELIAARCAERLADRSLAPAVFCACSLVRDRLMGPGPDLQPFVLSFVSPPVAAARYLRQLYSGRPIDITFVGACPSADDEAIDRVVTPVAFFAELRARGISLSHQPTVFDSTFAPDRRRSVSQPGGLPAPALLANHAVARRIIEIGSFEYAADLAQHLILSEPVLIDISARSGCACAGAAVGVPPLETRRTVVVLEPPRSAQPIVEPGVQVMVDLPLAPPPGGDGPRPAFVEPETGDRRPGDADRVGDVTTRTTRAAARRAVSSPADAPTPAAAHHQLPAPAPHALTEHPVLPAEWSALPAADWWPQPATDHRHAPPAARVADWSAQPVTEWSAQPATERPAQPAAERSAKPSAERPARPAAEWSAQPAAEGSARPAADWSAQARTEHPVAAADWHDLPAASGAGTEHPVSPAEWQGLPAAAPRADEWLVPPAVDRSPLAERRVGERRRVFDHTFDTQFDTAFRSAFDGAADAGQIARARPILALVERSIVEMRTRDDGSPTTPPATRARRIPTARVTTDDGRPVALPRAYVARRTPATTPPDLPIVPIGDLELHTPEFDTAQLSERAIGTSDRAIRIPIGREPRPVRRRPPRLIEIKPRPMYNAWRRTTHWFRRIPASTYIVSFAAVTAAAVFVGITVRARHTFQLTAVQQPR